MRGIAGIEEDLLAGLDREPHAPRGRAVEAQRAVRLEEVEVRRHADGHLALVDDGERRRPARASPGPGSPCGGGAVAVSGSCSTSSRLPSANSASTSIAPHEVGHAVEHVARPERAVARGLGLRVGAPVAGGLADLVGDQGDGLGLVEPQPAPAPLARQLGGEEQQQAVLLAREEAHGRGSLSRRLHAVATLERIPLGQLEAVVLAAGDLRATFVPRAPA